MLIKLLQSRSYWILPLIFWFVVVSLSVRWNVTRFDTSIEEIAYDRGRVMYQMVRMTKINPIIMQTQPELFKQQSMDIQYRVISNKPKNPENLANGWESVALNGFETEKDPVLFSDENYFRFIGPLYMQQTCLACHGDESSKVGDVRGGISVEIAKKPIVDSHIASKQSMLFMHFIGYLLISFTSIFFMYQLRKHWGLLEAAQYELKSQKQFLSDVTNSMSEGFVVLDQKGRVSYANPESVNILGWDGEAVVGSDFINKVYGKRIEEGFDINQSAVLNTINDGRVRKDQEDLFFNCQGEPVDVSLSVSPLIENDQSEGVVVLFSDIAERKKAESEQARLERELNQTHKMEAVGQLAGGIAHEINTPIQYVGDNLRFLKDSYEDFIQLLDSYRELLNEAASEERLKPKADHLLSLIDEIDLEYLREETPNAIEQSITGAEQVARIVSAMKEFAHPGSAQKEPADINRIITNTLTVCRNEWKYVAETELHLSEGLAAVMCVAGEISQVFLNLIVNAAHAIEAAECDSKGVIKISTSTNSDWFEIVVSDSGTGIPKEAQAYVFNPFFTTKDVGKGTGQGLAVAHDIVVSKHGGEISFQTEEGVGTSFIVRLPLSALPE